MLFLGFEFYYLLTIIITTLHAYPVGEFYLLALGAGTILR
jgi:hypothetical protein